MKNPPYELLNSYKLPCTVDRQSLIEGVRSELKRKDPRALCWYKPQPMVPITNSTDNIGPQSAPNPPIVTISEAMLEALALLDERGRVLFDMFQMIEHLRPNTPLSQFAEVGLRMNKLMNEYILKKMEEHYNVRD